MTDLSPQKAHRDYVTGVLFYYQQNDIQPGDPNEGDWEEAHYPEPARLGGDKTILLLKEHHAVQGVLQSEEYGMCCTSNRYASLVYGTEYEELHRKWAAIQGHYAGLIGGKTTWERYRGSGTLSARWEESAIPCVFINHSTKEERRYHAAMLACEDGIKFPHYLLDGWRESDGWFGRTQQHWDSLSNDEKEAEIQAVADWVNDRATQHRRNGRPTWIYDEGGRRWWYKSVKNACDTLNLTGSHLRRTLTLKKNGDYKFHKGYRMEYVDES